MLANISSNYYIQTAYGGWSPCIEGNNAYGLRPFAGSVLPNCTGYCTGRWNELLQTGDCRWLGSVAGKDLYALALSQGCIPSNVPQVGALMVWNDPNDDGHGAIVEVVYSNDDIETSESGYNYTTGPIVRTYRRQRGNNGLWGETKQDRTFTGFVLLPGTPAPAGTGSEGWYMFFHEGGKL